MFRFRHTGECRYPADKTMAELAIIGGGTMTDDLVLGNNTVVAGGAAIHDLAMIYGHNDR